MSGSQVAGFQAGDQVTMDQLLHCLLVYSANDAASAIAVQELTLPIPMVFRTKIIIQRLMTFI